MERKFHSLHKTLIDVDNTNQPVDITGEQCPRVSQSERALDRLQLQANLLAISSFFFSNFSLSTSTFFTWKKEK